MALQSPFFNSNNKREDGYPRPGVSPNAAAAAGQAPVAAAPQAAAATTATTPTKEGESKLTVGPNIKLKGVEITDCDTLVVEGSVEATMDSRVIQISERGAFKGSAEIDVAEIRGLFEGNLTVRQKLVIYSTGKVTGKVRYGKVVIEEGGQLSGEIEFGATASSTTAVRPAPAKLQVA
jgi:cytoskeletal protein CcmA (bactofilin family)